MTEPAFAGIPQVLRAVAGSEAHAMAQELSGIRAVVIATADGFEIAALARGALDPQRVAALASSISAIGEVVVSEAGLGRSTSVTVATDNGFAVVHAVTCRGVSLVINVIAGPDAVLAQVNYRAAAAARRLASA